MRAKTGLFVLTISIFMVYAISCSGEQKAEQKPGQKTEVKQTAQIKAPTVAIATLNPTEGNEVSGVVTFTTTDKGLRIVADVEGLTPGKHGFHIHEYGDCSAADGTSAGGHFNPFNKPHGAPTSMERHAGDLGNIVADENGKAHLDWTDPILKLGGENSIVGRAVIVHAGEDDLHSQPTGNAGPRVACGVIGLAKGPTEQE